MKRALLLLILTPAIFAAGRKTITHDELVRRTQELVDAVAEGNAKPWNEYYAADAIYFDEKGNRYDKKELVSEFAPLPPGYVGVIKVENAHSRFFGDTVVFDYDLDESLTIHGQKLDNARFHGTDTWIRRKGRWQIVATQMLRYYADPAVGPIDPRSLDLYTGTYELAPGVTMVVTREGDELSSQRGERPKERLYPEAPGVFFRKGVEGRLLFRDGLLIQRRNNQDVIWKKR